MPEEYIKPRRFSVRVQRITLIAILVAAAAIWVVGHFGTFASMTSNQLSLTWQPLEDKVYTGRILYRDGTPAADCKVEFIAPEATAEVTTGENGYFRHEFETSPGVMRIAGRPEYAITFNPSYFRRHENFGASMVVVLSSYPERQLKHISE